MVIRYTIHLSFLGVLFFPATHYINRPIEIDAAKEHARFQHWCTLIEFEGDIVVHIVPALIDTFVLTTYDEHLIVVSKDD